MLPPPSNADPLRARTGEERQPGDESGSVVRRAPFSDNPDVGARGQRTQQRILDAALKAFGEDGYHETGVARITELAGCSRPTFYQYFSTKEDVYRQLAGQVARQLRASAEALGTLTPDHDGWQELRAWVTRYSEIFERYRAVILAFPQAAETDEVLAGRSVLVGRRLVASLRSRLATTELRPRQLDPVIELLFGCVTTTHEDAVILSSALPDAFPRERVGDALADVLHRTLFGRREENVHPRARRRPPALEFSPLMREALQHDGATRPLTSAGQRTLDALTKAGRDLLVTRGYHATRVSDVVAAAGVSQGAFYRYFESKDQLVHVLAVQAIRMVSTALEGVGEPGSLDSAAPRPALRRWLRRYNETQASEAAMIRVWAVASPNDTAMRADSAAALDWGRRRLARFLEPRGFGDVDTEALVLLALLGAFGAQERPTPMVDAAAHIVERGFLGR
jgi:AcrR family transcriptional regulator